MNDNRRIRVAITHGDTNGIGYELIFRTFAEPEILELCTPIIYGSPKAAAFHRKALGLEPTGYAVISHASEAKDGRVNLVAVTNDEIKVELGTPSEEAGHAALMALDKAMVDYNDHLFDVLVTAPVSAESMKRAGLDFRGQMHYVAECFAEHAQAMNILVNDRMRIGLMTDNVAVKDIAHAITRETLTETIKNFAQTLKRDYRISNPRVAVLALNPEPGTEEKETIKPVIEALAEQKVNAFGPYTANHFFSNSMYDYFDGILAMYHDQGMAPFLAQTPEGGVEIASGLPLVCVQPLQDVSFDIAGKNEADETALRQAIYLAIDTCRNRAMYDEPLANPLPKLYHEKRDESEKVRFAIPKKHENSGADK